MSIVLTEIKNKVGIVTLNSEKTLNSLTVEMIEQLHAVLIDWKTNDEVACVFLQGAGEKALCAGGDVRKLYDAVIAQREIDPTCVPADCYEFFSKEYKLDLEIHDYPKPVIVWGNGIVMGGGTGLLAGASHRIVTNKTKMAMPEITIGLFPDVGGTWFLNQMESAYGLYLGLTGTRLEGSDCIFLGLADFYINSNAKEETLTALQKADWTGNKDEIAREVLREIAKDSSIPESKAKLNRAYIRKFERVQSVDEFRQMLLKLKDNSDWLTADAKKFESGSPSSAHVIFKQLALGKTLTLEQIFEIELNLICQCCVRPDFAEGVRALIVDKDQQPKWTPATLEEVTPAWIDSYFEPMKVCDNVEITPLFA